jgi:NTP pyrophosphatase (non-canonical NTP hydrolase)
MVEIETTPLEYFLSLLTEEMGEVSQGIGKAGRFGIDTPGVKDPLSGEIRMDLTPRKYIAKELGDVLAATMYGVERGVISLDEVEEAAEAKLAKLLDPEAKDNMGRRLAP